MFYLCNQISELYEKYAIFRPDWLQAWENNKIIDSLESIHQSWQSKLWKFLVERIDNIDSTFLTRTSIYLKLLNALKKKHYSKNLPSRIFIFGIAGIPPIYLEILREISKCTDVYILFNNPCYVYWGDECESIPCLFTQKNKLSFTKYFGIRKSNTLLSSWGKVGQDCLNMLINLPFYETLNLFTNIPSDNLLHNIQNDILKMRDPLFLEKNRRTFICNKYRRKLHSKDISLTIHVCHSPQREVEILHNTLLHLLETNHSLMPKDIIVMVTDIELYDPFIRATFGDTSNSYYVPYSVSKKEPRQSDPIIDAFTKLLDLPQSRLSSEDVMFLLDIKSLALRFNIDEKGKTYLYHWINECGIRWGIDDYHIRELGLPSTGKNTWDFGIKRMLLGYAMASDEGVWESILPYDNSNGSAADLIGHLSFLLSKINKWRCELKKKRTLLKWLPICHDILHDFFLLNASTEGIISFLKAEWKYIITEGNAINYTKKIPISILKDELKKLLENRSINHFFSIGPINFCTFLPMRSVPFKVVCILGMNENLYPRILIPSSFDLIHRYPRTGDRSHTDDDRYLFLEAIMSAKEKLHISYTGHSLKDDAICHPSSILKELIDYISYSYYLEGDEQVSINTSIRRVKQYIISTHERTPFSPNNYSSEENNYAIEWFSTANKYHQKSENISKSLTVIKCKKNLSLETLKNFWIHPVRAFFQMRLHSSFKDFTQEVSVIEPFELSPRKKYEINQQILHAFIKKKNLDLVYKNQCVSGDLPIGEFGKLIWEKQKKEMKIFSKKILENYRIGKNMEVSLMCNNVRLQGIIRHVQSDGLLRWSPVLNRTCHGIRLWIEHLIYCCMGGCSSSRVFLRNGVEWKFSPLSKVEANKLLTVLIDGYFTGMNYPLFFLPESGLGWLKSCYSFRQGEILTDDETQEKAKRKFFSIYHGTNRLKGEKYDIWYQKLFGNLKPETYKYVTKTIKFYLLPMLRHVKF